MEWLIRILFWQPLLLVALAGAAPAQDAARHAPLGQEGIYDREGPGLPFLQQPEEALGSLPPGRLGNHVDWMQALEGGYIEPHTGLDPDARMNALDMNVLMNRTASMPYVAFPHRQHTLWLSCTNCHPAIFLPKKDGNPVTMYAILSGEYCGVCHGKVAFPLIDCFRCHNTAQDTRSLSR